MSQYNVVVNRRRQVVAVTALSPGEEAMTVELPDDLNDPSKAVEFWQTLREKVGGSAVELFGTSPK